MDSRPTGKRSLLHSPRSDGVLHVPGVEDDANDGNRSAAAGHDEVHAHRDGGNVCGYPVPERPGRVYSYQRSGRRGATVVAEPHASAAARGEPGARQEKQEQETVNGRAVRSAVLFHNIRSWLRNLFRTAN